MLRGLAFYGANGALTFFDPVQGASCTEIPVSGSSEKVTIEAVMYVNSAPATREFCNIVIGTDGDYHDLQLYPLKDGDNMTADLDEGGVIDLGSWDAKEGIPISGTAPATGNSSGVLWFEDGEPEIPIPQGRVVFIAGTPSGDSPTTWATTNIGQTNGSKPLSVDSEYFIRGVTVMPQDALIQAIGFKVQGQCALGPPKGRILFPSCPCRFKGTETYNIFAQVQAVTEVNSIWEAVEVPKGQVPVSGTKTTPKAPFTGFGGNVQAGGSGSFQLFRR